MQVSVARESTDNEADAGGRALDFKVDLAREALRNATFQLQEMQMRLNARPGTGMNFTLVYEIARAEREVLEARATLISAEQRARHNSLVRARLPRVNLSGDFTACHDENGGPVVGHIYRQGSGLRSGR